jgi:hypothetical protein
MFDVRDITKNVAEALQIDDLKKVAKIVEDELIRREVQRELEDRFMTKAQLLTKIKQGCFDE